MGSQATFGALGAHTIVDDARAANLVARAAGDVLADGLQRVVGQVADLVAAGADQVDVRIGDGIKVRGSIAGVTQVVNQPQSQQGVQCGVHCRQAEGGKAGAELLVQLGRRRVPMTMYQRAADG